MNNKQTPKGRVKKERQKRIVFETFNSIGEWTIHSLQQNEPSCFNREVRVVRYRVTIEEIEEPLDVLAERLRMLWETSRNIHDYDPLISEATRLGIELDRRSYRSK
jgi:hypothetical protein